MVGSPRAILRGALLPSCGAMCSAYSPDSSEKYATLVPSGDQAGLRSITPGVLVRFRASPFSSGTVMISPRPSNTARTPLGEIDALVRRVATFTKRSRTSSRSPVTLMLTASSRADLRS